MSGGGRRDLRERVEKLVEPLLAHEGYELVDLEIAGVGPGTVVRLFIDKEGGVSLDDCASVSEAVDAMLDVEDPFDASYTLEVSSPGLDRPLRKAADYERFAGKKAKIKTFGPLESAGGRKVFTGTLVGRDADAVRIDVDGTVYAVPDERIAKAHLVFEFEPKRKPGK